MNDESAQLEARALRLLARRDHGREELRGKLLQKEDAEPDQLDRLLDEFERRNWLNDERYAEQYVRFRREKGFGPLRIRSELRQKGIASELVRQQIDALDDWDELLVQAAERRFGSVPATERREQARRARFLEGRGFPSDMIADYLWRSSSED